MASAVLPWTQKAGFYFKNSRDPLEPLHSVFAWAVVKYLIERLSLTHFALVQPEALAIKPQGADAFRHVVAHLLTKLRIPGVPTRQGLAQEGN